MAGKIEIHRRTVEVFAADDKLIAAGNLRPQPGKPAVVVVQVPGSQGTAADTGQPDFPQPFEQGRDEEHRRPQPAGERFGKVRPGQVGGIDRHHLFVGEIVHRSTHVAHEFKRHEDIVQRRYVSDDAATLIGKQGCRQHGENGVFGSLDTDTAG